MTRSLPYLILANLVPLVGVLAFDWDAASVLGVYWIETLVIGGFTALRILTCATPEGPRRGGMHRFALAPFFLLHFGVFSFVHGQFLAFLLGRSPGTSRATNGIERLSDLVARLYHDGDGIRIAIAALVASHGASYLLNYWIGRERETVELPKLMFAPYRRIATMHVTVLLGAFFIGSRDRSLGLLVALVVVKTALDARAHLQERRRAAATPPDAAASAPTA